MFGSLILLFEGINLYGACYIDEVDLTEWAASDFGSQDVFSSDFNVSELHGFKYFFDFDVYKDNFKCLNIWNF